MPKALEDAWNFCSKCGTKVTQKGTYCHECGERVASDPAHAGHVHFHERHHLFMGTYVHPLFCTRCGGKL